MSIIVYIIAGIAGVALLSGSLFGAGYKIAYKKAAPDAAKYAELKNAFLAYDELQSVDARLPDGTTVSCYPKGPEWQRAYERVRKAADHPVYWMAAWPGRELPSATPTEGDPQ